MDGMTREADSDTADVSLRDRSVGSTPRIVIVGGGPMGIYALKHLTKGTEPLDITIIDRGDTIGPGMPYAEGTNADYMLCNAFSREIPPLTRSLYGWLKTQPARELDEWELSPDDVSPRAFYPRTLLGAYLRDEAEAVLDRAQAAGHCVRFLTGREVADVAPAGAAMRVDLGGGAGSVDADAVLITTGHVWPETPRVGDATLLSPWPVGGVTGLPPGRIGILGSSLSAVDVAVALAHAHGSFVPSGPRLLWLPGPAAEGLRITMVSRKGVLPEADFYYPYPYEALVRLTPHAVEAEVARGAGGLLDRVFALVLAELAETDPAYVDALGPEGHTVEGFAEAYFADRQNRGAFRALRDTLAEARASMRRRETIAFRYTLLRGHEVVDAALRHLDPGDWDRFARHLLPVFADCYAAVPHLSLARLLALHEAGVLDVVASGDDAVFGDVEGGGVTVSMADETIAFDAMVDARGQAAAPLAALPFPGLVAALDPAHPPVEAPFRLRLRAGTAPVYCLAMPQLLERQPFSQGLANCDTLARDAADDLIAVLARPGPAAPEAEAAGVTAR